ncbi:hypothetical protein SDIAM26S_05720 [Streptomyces diastaticus subsp. diastaticus]
MRWAANFTGPRVASVTRAVVAKLLAPPALEFPAPTTTSRAVREGGRAAVVGGVQNLPGELHQARQLRPVRSAERPGSRDDGPRPEPAAAFEDHFECRPVSSHGGDALTGADIDIQAVGVGGEVGGDLITMRVSAAVGTGERHPGQGAVPGG